MAARNVRGRLSPNRPGASDDVISISSDSDSEFNMEDDDESLPSISAIFTSMFSVGPARTESIGEHSHATGTVLTSSQRGITKSEAFTRGNRDISAPSSPNSPKEPGFPSRSHFGHPAKTSKPTEFVNDSKESTSSTRNQHNAGMSFSSCSSKQKTSVESVSSRHLFVETAPLGYPIDKGPHYQHTNPFHHAGLVYTNSLSILSSNQHTTGALAQANLAGSNQQESAHDASRFSTLRGLSSDKGRQENRQIPIKWTIRRVDLKAPGDNPHSQMHSNRNPKSSYNLRPAPLKRRYGEGRLVTSKDTTSMQSGKRLKLGGSESDASVFQMDCLLVRWRKHIFLVKWYDHSGAINTTWEPRRNILDKRILANFEKQWRGFDKGVDVLRTRQRGGKRQYLLHWHGRPSNEDTWLNEDLLSPQLIDRHQEKVSNV